MKLFNKITFTVTIDEANNINTAIRFLETACKNGIIKNAADLYEFNYKHSTDKFTITNEGMNKLTEFGRWIKSEVEELEADNEEFNR